MPEMITALAKRADGSLLIAAEGLRRAEEAIEADAATFFDGGWVFVGLASQVPRKHDFLTTRIGRQPLVLMRGHDEQLHCVHNSCRHKGAVVCHERRGNRRIHVCRYHSWSYDSSGCNIGIKSTQGLIDVDCDCAEAVHAAAGPLRMSSGPLRTDHPGSRS